MSYDLTGKSLLITGGGSGLGRAVAKKVAQEGAKVALVDLNATGLEQTKAEILTVSPGAEVLLITADVSSESAVESFVRKTKETFGSIDGFYNNAGIEGQQMGVADFDSADFDKVVNINLKGVSYGLKYVIQVMREQRSGYIVNVASVAGIRATQQLAAYIACKHAVAGLTKSAALDYGEFISVNAIAPGVILTHMVEESVKKSAGDNWEAALAEIVSVNPKKRAGKPEEVAELVTFLLSGKAPYLNGAVIAIDGGQSNVY